MFAFASSSVARATKKKVPTSRLIQQLTSGTGATRLVPHIKTMLLEVNQKPQEPGEREFLRDVLPKLAFANPQIPISVTHHAKQAKSTPSSTTAAEAANQDASAAETSSAASPAMSAASEDPAQAEAQTQTQEPKISSLTLTFANIPSRKIILNGKTSAAITSELLNAVESKDSEDKIDIPRFIGWDPKVEAARQAAEAERRAKAEAAAAAAEEAAAEAAQALTDSTRSSSGTYSEEAEYEDEQPRAQAEEPSATNLTGSAEGLSDVDGVAQVNPRSES